MSSLGTGLTLQSVNKPINLSGLADENMPKPALYPIKALKSYVEVSASWWHTDELFVSFRKNHKGASMFKDSLAHWVKETIVQLYVGYAGYKVSGIYRHIIRCLIPLNAISHSL